MKKKVIISACLLGENCRYDGKTKAVNAVMETYKEYEIIPFCPEAPLFGTPRERISVVKVEGAERIIQDNSGEDVTLLLEDEIYKFIIKNPDVDTIVLKSKSPSCGNGTTPVLDKDGNFLYWGSGIATKIFQEHYAIIPLLDENSPLLDTSTTSS